MMSSQAALIALKTSQHMLIYIKVGIVSKCSRNCYSHTSTQVMFQKDNVPPVVPGLARATYVSWVELAIVCLNSTVIPSARICMEFSLCDEAERGIWPADEEEEGLLLADEAKGGLLLFVDEVDL